VTDSHGLAEKVIDSALYPLHEAAMGAILLKGGVFGRATIRPLPLGVDKTARSAGEGCFREGAKLPVGMPSPPPSPRGRGGLSPPSPRQLRERIRHGARQSRIGLVSASAASAVTVRGPATEATTV